MEQNTAKPEPERMPWVAAVGAVAILGTLGLLGLLWRSTAKETERIRAELAAFQARWDELKTGVNARLDALDGGVRETADRCRARDEELRKEIAQASEKGATLEKDLGQVKADGVVIRQDIDDLYAKFLQSIDR
jgi:chromosome segregation ATPase